MKIVSLIILVAGLVLFVLSVWLRLAAKKFKSQHNLLTVERKEGLVTFRYKYNGSRMSSLDLTNESFLVVPYTRYLFCPIFVNSQPANTLHIGLGAGAYNRLHRRLYPEQRLATVEIDPMIVKLAKEYADFKESEKNEIHVEDARMFLKHHKEKWDWIVIDAFDAEADIPMHLTTMEFFQLLSGRLTNNGCMTINLHGAKPIILSQTATLRKAFPQAVLFSLQGSSTNIIALCTTNRDTDLFSLVRDADISSLPDLTPYGVDLKVMQEHLVSIDDFLQGKQYIILTDDYAQAKTLSK